MAVSAAVGGVGCGRRCWLRSMMLAAVGGVVFGGVVFGCVAVGGVGCGWLCWL